LAKLYVEHILNGNTLKGIRKALTILPPLQLKIYARIIGEIHLTQNRDGIMAFLTFTWIFHAVRPLVPDELLEALSIDVRFASHKFVLADVLRCCWGLVVVGEQTKTIQFVHPTVREFFASTQDSRFLMPVYELAVTCLQCLKGHVYDKLTYIPDSSTKSPSTGDNFRVELPKNYGFITYAVKYWAVHARGDGERRPDIQDLMLTVFENPAARNLLYQIESLKNNDELSLTGGNTSVVHLLSRKNLPLLLRKG
jgi:hypothetical protein